MRPDPSYRLPGPAFPALVEPGRGLVADGAESAVSLTPRINRAALG